MRVLPDGVHAPPGTRAGMLVLSSAHDVTARDEAIERDDVTEERLAETDEAISLGEVAR